MLTSIKQVDTEFFKQFHNLTIPGLSKQAHYRFYKKSAEDYTEEDPNQVYPCIAVQNYTPTLKDEWFVDMKEYFGGLSSDGQRGFLYRRPVWFEFRYDVSIASKSYNDHTALADYFQSHFVCGKLQFLFNKRLDGELAVGDVVPFTVRATDIPRIDGVYETNYEFTLSAWLYLVEPEEVATIQQAILELIQVG